MKFNISVLSINHFKKNFNYIILVVDPTATRTIKTGTG